MTNKTTEKKNTERALRAWETRRANMAARGYTSSVETTQPVVTKARKAKKRRGRSITATAELKPNAVSSVMEFSNSTFTLDQIKDLGVLAVTEDGKVFKVLKKSGKLVYA